MNTGPRKMFGSEMLEQLQVMIPSGNRMNNLVVHPTSD